MQVDVIKEAEAEALKGVEVAASAVYKYICNIKRDVCDSASGCYQRSRSGGSERSWSGSRGADSPVFWEYFESALNLKWFLMRLKWHVKLESWKELKWQLKQNHQKTAAWQFKWTWWRSFMFQLKWNYCKMLKCHFKQILKRDEMSFAVITVTSECNFSTSFTCLTRLRPMR